MKRILVLCFNDLKNDARVTRQIDFLLDDHQVTALCFDAYDRPGLEIYRVQKTKLTLFRKTLLAFCLLLRLDDIAYNLLHDHRKNVKDLRARNFDLIVANDAETLPLAFQIANAGTKVYFDAHEYAPRQFEDRLYWRIFFQRFISGICKKFISRTAGISTINKGLADAYEQNFGRRPTIITNAAPFHNLLPVERNEYPIRLVHHGIFNMSRRPEIMVELMEILDHRFSLDLIYLLPENASPKTRAYFEEISSRAGRTGKIRVLPALKSNAIVSTLHVNYDMGIILVPPVNFNYENGLPNKLFDCIQARLAMAVGPLKEIAEVTTNYNIGVVSETFTAQAMAASLRDVTLERIKTFKHNANVAAGQMNSEMNKSIFLADINAILS